MRFTGKIGYQLIAAAVVAAGLSCGVAVGGSVATFEDLGLPANSFWNGADNSGGFTSGGIQFPNVNYGGGYFDGWTYSSMTDTTTPGLANQYSAIPGGGAQGSATYGVAYQFYPNDPADTITLPRPMTVEGAYFTNTTYAYLSMLNGDSFAKKFGSGDWFDLTITGFDSAGVQTGTPVVFPLADYSTANHPVNQWTWVPLTGLGNDVSSIAFGLSSTDNGQWGMNTPAYFAMDALTTPEPSTCALLAVGLLGAAGYARRSRILGRARK